MRQDQDKRSVCLPRRQKGLGYRIPGPFSGATRRKTTTASGTSSLCKYASSETSANILYKQRVDCAQDYQIAAQEYTHFEIPAPVSFWQCYDAATVCGFCVLNFVPATMSTAKNKSGVRKGAEKAYVARELTVACGAIPC